MLWTTIIQHLSGIFENNEDEPAAGQKNDGNQLKCNMFLEHIQGREVTTSYAQANSLVIFEVNQFLL